MAATLVQSVIGDSVPSNTNNFDIGGGIFGNVVVFPGDTAAGNILAAIVATAIDGTGHITKVADSVTGDWPSVLDSVNDTTADQWVGSFATNSPLSAPLKVAAWSGTACTIASGTLTVGGTFSGIVRAGQIITGTVANLRITALGTGTGGAGTYTINSNTASFASGTLGGSDCITVFYSAFGDFQGTYAIEVSGSQGVKAHAGRIQTSTSGTDSWSSGTASCPGNGLIVGFANNASESAATWAPNAGTGFGNSSKMWKWSNAQNNATAEWDHFTAPGTRGATFTPTAADSADVFMLYFQDADNFYGQASL